MVARSWDNSPTKARPTRHRFHTPAVLAEQRDMSGLSFHPRRGDCDPGNLHQLGHVIRLEFGIQLCQIEILHKATNKIVPELTPIDLMDRQFSFEDKKICTSPVAGSSISPVSPATLDRRLARTSDAAVSNYTKP